MLILYLFNHGYNKVVTRVDLLSTLLLFFSDMTKSPPPGQSTGTTSAAAPLGISAADLAAALQAFAATSGQPAPQPSIPKYEYDHFNNNNANCCWR